MSLQLRRGTDAERLTITPANGEPIWTIDTDKLYIGDGTTVGGRGVTPTGGVTEIVAGDNISINTSTGAVTISATGGSTATFSNLTVLDDLFFNEGDNLSSISREGGALRFQSSDGQFVFESLDEQGVNVVSSNQITVAQLMPLVGENTGTIVLYGQLEFGTSGLGIKFNDATIQTTAGGTSVYARSALPAGVQGRIITISDSGSDANSPAGNWAPAYWDDDADEWTYVGNSNSVTII
jgi:hypothetical protein